MNTLVQPNMNAFVGTAETGPIESDPLRHGRDLEMKELQAAAPPLPWPCQRAGRTRSPGQTEPGVLDQRYLPSFVLQPDIPALLTENPVLRRCHWEM